MKKKINLLYILRYIICMFFLFSFLKIISNLYLNEYSENKLSSFIEKTSIIDENNNIEVYFPRFKDGKINKIITDYIYGYVKVYKKSDSKNKILKINYEINSFNEYINVVFYINNSLSTIKNHNILINTKNKSCESVTKIVNEEFLNTKIQKEVENKYSQEIYNSIQNKDYNNFTYIFKNNTLLIYFNDVYLYNIGIPYIKINLEDQVVFSDISKIKYVVFTFDDGPSEYTLDILNLLEENNSSATFFEIGEKMVDYKDVVIKINNSNSEIASHSYSHKDLTLLNTSNLYSEYNSTSIIFNEITSNNIKYLRPPYGKYNKKILSTSPYPLFLWSIDTKDWEHKDTEKTVNNIISNVFDGAIVLMHDTNSSTVEAVRKVIPILKNMNYEIVSISDILDIKNIKIGPTDIINKF